MSIICSPPTASLRRARSSTSTGAGNRVASAIYGHKKVWIVVGKNKLAPTYDEALWRARNIAAPKNAQRLHAKTPCAVKADLATTARVQAASAARSPCSGAR